MTTVTSVARGIYQKDIGYCLSESGRLYSHRFYLGKNQAEATARAAKIHTLWSRYKQTVTGTPLWSADLLTVAQALSRGEDVVHPLMMPVKRKKSGMLHEALDGFCGYLRKKPDISRTWSLNACRALLWFHRHLPDCFLAEVDAAYLDRVHDLLLSRPTTKYNKPLSVGTAQQLNKLWRGFLRWLNRSDYDWSYPPNWIPRQLTIKYSQEEMIARKTVKTYSIAELKILWQYATPPERVLLTLALNCGFGAAEIGSLSLDQVQGQYIKRHRTKTYVYGEWFLFPETLQAIQWVQAHRPNCSSSALIVTGDGTSIIEPYYSGNRNHYIAMALRGLLRRVKKDHPKFRRLSFGKFRKTAASMIREIGGGEVTSLFLAHGEATTDKQLENYAARSYHGVHEAIKTVRERLADVFTVAEPFPADYKPSRVVLTTAQRQRLKGMRHEGMTVRAIAHEIGCSVDTVRRHLPKPSMAQAG